MILDLFRLNGKTALVTGATHGLGMAMAGALGQAGARILFNGHSSRQKVAEAEAMYRSRGLEAHGYLLDLNDPGDVTAVVTRMEQEHGGIDILVNNAGIIRRVPLLDMPLEEWDLLLRTDLTGPFVVSKAVVPGMIRRGGGKIINICSMMSELGRDTVAAYAAAKGGLKMLTRGMATEWARHNIQVNGIGPGYFATEQTAPLRVAGNAFHEFILQRTPAGRWGDPAELGGAVVYLASPASNFVSGHILYVDGGLLASIGKPAGQ